jgi:hypothetical protein
MLIIKHLATAAVVVSLVSMPVLAQRAADQFLNIKLMVNTGDKPAATDSSS